MMTRKFKRRMVMASIRFSFSHEWRKSLSKKCENVNQSIEWIWNWIVVTKGRRLWQWRCVDSNSLSFVVACWLMLVNGLMVDPAEVEMMIEKRKKFCLRPSNWIPPFQHPRKSSKDQSRKMTLLWFADWAGLRSMYGVVVSRCYSQWQSIIQH